MSTIADSIERLETAVTRRRGFGVGTSRSVTTVSDAGRCTSSEGQWSVESDLSTALGGNGSAPTPSVLLRAAVGSCVALGYRLRAAKHRVELTSLRVTVEADSEIAGMLFCDSTAPPGYTEIRVHVDIVSAAPVDDVRRVLDEGDRLSPLLDVLTRANSVVRTTSIRSGEA